ncbi:Histidine phosphatase superfamily [Phytophthora cactorum]|nr:Histidine phosphatase superfamily [Phytophthora cactorum]
MESLNRQLARMKVPLIGSIASLQLVSGGFEASSKRDDTVTNIAKMRIPAIFAALATLMLSAISADTATDLSSRAPNPTVKAHCPNNLPNIQSYSMEKVGDHIREVYVNEKGFLSPIFNGRKTIRTSRDTSERTQQIDAARVLWQWATGCIPRGHDPAPGLTPELVRDVSELAFQHLIERLYSTPTPIAMSIGGFPQLLVRHLREGASPNRNPESPKYLSYHGHREPMHGLGFMMAWSLTSRDYRSTMARPLHPASTLFFELHRKGDDHFVQLFVWSPFSPRTTCELNCPLNEFTFIIAVSATGDKATIIQMIQVRKIVVQVLTAPELYPFSGSNMLLVFNSRADMAFAGSANDSGSSMGRALVRLVGIADSAMIGVSLYDITLMMKGSDADSTATLVFASGDESESNNHAGPAAQTSVVQDVEAGDATDTVDHAAVVTSSTPVGNRDVSAVSASTSSAPTITTPRAHVCSASLFSRVHPAGSDKQSLRPLVPLLSPVHGPQPFVWFSKQVVKWAQPFMTPPLCLQGAFKCWTQILNCRLPTPVPPATKIPCCSKFIKTFGNYKDPDHPWQRSCRLLPERAYRFGTEDFDPDSHVSQRAPPLARLRGFWRTFRGYGPEEDVDLGFLLWERDHWISARAIELFLSTGYRVLEEDSILALTTKAQLRHALDEAKAAW